MQSLSEAQGPQVPLVQIVPAAAVLQSVSLEQLGAVMQAALAPPVQICPDGQGFADEHGPHSNVVAEQICGDAQSCEVRQPGWHMCEKLQVWPRGH
jgi:hypothetical protein